MSRGNVRVSKPLTYAMPGKDPKQRTPDAIATISLRGPRGGFIGSEDIDITAARAAHQALSELLAAHQQAGRA